MTKKLSTTATIIAINRHRIDRDGTGVNTLVAFHGCPLRCKYCLNPMCLDEEYECDTYSVQELLQEVAIDNLYFHATQGGVTFGGGEPLLRSAFIKDFCEACPKEWKMKIETCLNVPLSHVQEVSPYISEWIIDIKDMDDDIYFKYTSKHNARVLENLKWLSSQDDIRPRILVRVPRIPNYNNQDNINSSIKTLKSLGLNNINVFTYSIKT